MQVLITPVHVKQMIKNVSFALHAINKKIKEIQASFSDRVVSSVKENAPQKIIDSMKRLDDVYNSEVLKGKISDINNLRAERKKLKKDFFKAIDFLKTKEATFKYCVETGVLTNDVLSFRFYNIPSCEQTQKNTN